MVAHCGSAVTAGAELRTVHFNNCAMNAHCLAQRRHAHARGFTLIELMIVVAIVAIIAAVALPAYFGSVRKSRRADAITALSQIAQAQERWRANNTTYTTVLTSAGLNVPNPSSGYYTLGVSGASGTGYTATATAAGAQLADTQCSSLTLTMAAGTITYTAVPAANANRCWNR
jgi:type IV pilus assembly protein PilE